jgi:hypothetical protein
VHRGIYLTDLVRLEEHPDNLPPPKRPEPTIPAHLGPNATIPDIVGKGIPNNNTPKAKATLINFSKRRKVYDVIANKLQQYQQLTYNFQPGAWKAPTFPFDWYSELTRLFFGHYRVQSTKSSGCCLTCRTWRRKSCTACRTNSNPEARSGRRSHRPPTFLVVTCVMPP